MSFDLDGVLIRNPFAAGVFPRVRASIRECQHFRERAPQEADEVIDAAIREEWGRRMASGDFVSAYDWDSIFRSVSERFGGGPTPDVSQLVEECCAEEDMIALLPGARECLEELRHNGLKLVAATNGYRAYQWPVLEALGIAELFDELLSPDRTGFAKPSREYFSQVPGLFAHIGDTLEHDVLGANLAGLLSVWLSTELGPRLKAVEPADRTSHPAFETHLKLALSKALYRDYHPAPLEAFKPALVAAHLHEIPSMILAAVPAAEG